MSPDEWIEKLTRVMYYLLPRSADPRAKAEQICEEYFYPSMVVETDWFNLRNYYGLSEINSIYLSSMPGVVRAIHREHCGEHPLMGSLWQAKDYMDSLYIGKQREEVYIIALDKRNHVKGSKMIMRGTSDTVNLPFPLVLDVMAEFQVSRIIVCHNHPCGGRQFSMSDYHTTRRFLEMARLVHLTVVDHVLYVRNRIHSMRAERWIGEAIWQATGPLQIPREKWLAPAPPGTVEFKVCQRSEQSDPKS